MSARSATARPPTGRPRAPVAGPATVAVAVALLAALAASPSVAQEVAFTPRPDRPAERRLAAFLERGDFRVLSRDTVLAAGDTLAGDVLVLGATLRASGRLDGDVYAVAGDVFLRPGAAVAGDVVVLSGGYYDSERAAVEGTVTYRPNLLLRIVPRNGGWEIFHPREELPAVELHGLSGLHAPAYRRVDGWTFGWGGTVRATGLPGQPSLDGSVRFHTAGPRQLEGTLRASFHPTGGLRLAAMAERGTRTRDGWILGDLVNTASYLVGLGDHRNYYRAERAAVELAATAREGWAPALAVGVEEARSLAARPLGVLFEDDADVRPNPPVDPGRITSLRAELAYRDRRPGGRFVGLLELEAADSTVAGDFSFLLAGARLTWRGRIVSDHRLEVRGLARRDLAGTLPRQRWSALGGTGSLPALETLSLRGPRMVFVSTTWLAPVEPLRVAVLGVPKFFLRNAVGTAWAEGDPFTLEDNVMAGVRFLFLEAGLAVDVTAADPDPEFVLGAGFPGGFWH